MSVEIHTELKHERIPGCGGLFSSLKAINSKIQEKNSSISNYREEIKKLLETENLPKKQLYAEMDLLKDSITKLSEERGNLIDEQRNLIEESKILREELFAEKKNSSEKSVLEELKRLESHIIKFKLSRKEETEIVDKQIQLKKQLKGMKGLREKENKLLNLNSKISEIKNILKKKGDKIFELKTQKNSIYGEIKALTPQKSPQLINLENSIKEIETLVKEFIKTRGDLRKEIAEKQKEFEEKKEFYLKKQNLKDELGEKNRNLNELLLKKENLIKEMGGNQISKGKIFLEELKRIDFSKELSMSVNLFGMFAMFDLKLSDKEKNIEKMEKKIAEMESSVEERKENLKTEIKEISEDIKNKKDEISIKLRELKELVE